MTKSLKPKRGYSRTKKIKIVKPVIPQAYWAPQVGPQFFASISPMDITFFGGTRGGGKSDCLIGRHIGGVQKYGNHWNGLIIRRKFKDFAELRRRWDELIINGLPAERIGGDQQTNYIRFKDYPNAQIVMTAVTRAEMLDTFQSQQYTEVSVDEAPNIPFIDRLIDKLKGSLRSPHGVPSHMFLTGNPGGPGSTIIKEMFIKPEPEGIGTPQIDEDGWSSGFIKSTIDDNQILCKNDPNYVRRLKAIKDRALRRAWLEGDWDVFVGQAFRFVNDYVENGGHLIKPVPIPEFAPIYMSYDWGYGAPFSVGWWWADANNRLYRFDEWYGWNRKPNQGIRLADSEVAAKIVEREKALGIHERVTKRFAPPDCFSKKPSYERGGQGPSTYEEFKKYGLMLTKIYPDRQLKMRQFRERLLLPEKDMPMMVIYDTCTRFIDTIPALCLDEDNIEDIDTEQEDHVYDEAALMCLARPVSMNLDEIREITAKKEKEQIEASLDNASRAAWGEVAELREKLETEREMENDLLGIFGGIW